MLYVPVGSEKSKPVKNIYGFKKVCSKCGHSKSLRSFYRRGGTGLLQSRCIKCTKDASIASRERVINKIRTIRRRLGSGRFIEI